MTEDVRILLDEHVSRIFQRLLEERGFTVQQACDRFGERTTDAELLEWAGENGWLVLTNDAKDFHRLHRTIDHGGILLFYDQTLQSDDPEGLARAVDEVVSQYGAEGTTNELVDLEEWYEWLRRFG